MASKLLRSSARSKATSSASPSSSSSWSWSWSSSSSSWSSSSYNHVGVAALLLFCCRPTVLWPPYSGAAAPRLVAVLQLPPYSGAAAQKEHGIDTLHHTMPFPLHSTAPTALHTSVLRTHTTPPLHTMPGLCRSVENMKLDEVRSKDSDPRVTNRSSRALSPHITQQIKVGKSSLACHTKCYVF